jgi:hypothetical protein
MRCKPQILLLIAVTMLGVGCSSGGAKSSDSGGTATSTAPTVDQKTLANLPPDAQSKVREVEARTDMPDIAKSMEINRVMSQQGQTGR